MQSTNPFTFISSFESNSNLPSAFPSTILPVNSSVKPLANSEVCIPINTSPEHQVVGKSTLKPCPGITRISDDRNWYIPKNKSADECTYCEECYDNYIKGTPTEKNYYYYSGLTSCNCDYPKEYTNYGITVNNIRLYVSNSKTHQIYKKISNPIANINGVVHIVMPTCTPYNITLENIDQDDNSYFTLESIMVGDKEINIDNGEQIYYRTLLDIKGLAAVLCNSLFFMAPSNKEKMENINISTNNDSGNYNNVINLKIQKWKREKDFPVRLLYSCLSDCRLYDCDDGKVNYIRGGIAVAGCEYVDHLTMTQTKDTFEPTSEVFEFTIQLICEQTDEEKYVANMDHYLQRDAQKRNELIKQQNECLEKVKEKEMKMRELQAEIENEQVKLRDVEKELLNFVYLGSSDHNEYLIKL